MVKKEDLPQWEEFGDILISPGDLYFKDKLVLATNKKKRITGFTVKRLSPHMVKIFNQILKDQQPADIHLMTPDEVLIYNTTLRRANLHKKFPVHEVVNDIKRRVTILEGEIAAGNDNKLLKRELRHLVVYLYTFGCITKGNMDEYLKSLK
jgi:hypothetical protein